MKLKTKEGKGITLIALVITIIVLLILAGVTILALTGENGILTQANNAKEQNNRAKSEEEVKLAIANLKIEESQKDMNQEEKANVLKKELQRSYPEQKTESTVSIIGTGFLINHRGCEFEIDKDYNVFYKEPFDSEEWDKLATPEECFIWEENTIIGLNIEKLSGVEKIIIPSKCTKIRCDYYSGNESYRSFATTIKSVEIPDTVIEIGDFAFHNYKGLEKITIPNSVKRIGISAFSYCTSLNSVVIPNSVTDIGSGAFAYCTNLSEIEMSDNVVSIGSGVLSGTTWYNNQSDGVLYINKVLYGYKGIMPNDTEIVTKEGTAVIADSAFSSVYSRLTGITIPNSIVTIGNNAFENCHNLTNITIPNSVQGIGDHAFYSTGETSITIPSSVTNIGKYAFSCCDNLTNATIPNSISKIPEGLFWNCDKLENVTISEGISSIGEMAFANCSSLTSINIPKGVTIIESIAFTYCSNLTTVTMAEGITDIGGSAFSECSNLTTITIPESVVNIGRYAFQHCNNLDTVYFKQILKPSFGDECFYKNTGVNTKFYFKNSMVSDEFTTSYYNPSYGTKCSDYNW